jgi:CRP/FNR family cyclic AMP-dependent transcriptional regulator
VSIGILILLGARRLSELAAMSEILQLIQDREVGRFEAGQIVMEQCAETHRLYVLIEGEVEVMKDGVRVSTISEAGATFGEMSVLLQGTHTATVRALTACSFHVIENPRELLQTSPRICFHVCVLLARRLDSLTRYLVDVKRQFEGHDHIGMVDEVLEALLHRQPKDRVRPRESTIGRGESLE